MTTETWAVRQWHYSKAIINKGNSCYANSILQALSLTPALWSQSAWESFLLWPSPSCWQNQLSKSSTVIDPSSFLRELQRKMSSIKDKPFNINSQQDVPEILLHALNELAGSSVIPNNIITNIVRTTISCNSGFLSSSRMESMSTCHSHRWFCKQSTCWGLTASKEDLWKIITLFPVLPRVTRL